MITVSRAKALSTLFLVALSLLFLVPRAGSQGSTQQIQPRFFSTLSTPGACSFPDFYVRPDTGDVFQCGVSNDARKVGFDVAGTYLSQADAASTYLTQAAAATTLGAGWETHVVAFKLACASTNPCLTLDGVEQADLPAGLTQTIVIAALPAKGFVEFTRLKTSTAFAGTTTLTATLGTTGTANLYTAAYNLKTAVAATNLSPGLPAGAGSDTASATNITFKLTATVDDLSSLTAGVVSISFKTSLIP